jgi:hypothetical protein
MARKPRKKPIVALSFQEQAHMDRLARLQDFREGRGTFSNIAVMRRNIGGGPVPNVTGLGDRSVEKYSWLPMNVRIVDAKNEKDAAKVLDPDVLKEKASRKADYVGTYYGHRGVLRLEYDMLEPFTLVDTEAYLKQAINRRMSLIMRNGYEVVSDKAQYADYIKRRLERMEFVTRRPIMNLFRDILTCLSLCSNCFLLKIRDEEGSGVPKKEGGRIPVAGYSLVPPHTIFPYMEKGVISKWRRYYDTGLPYEDYALEDIIHLQWDRKPGQIAGTPRTVGVKDDIFALRRLEENVELLFINHLFPLFHVQVGTPEAPCTYYPDGSSEIDLIRHQIEAMPKEGVFVTDERVKVAAVGAKNESLETEKLITHLKGRVYTGLGMSPLDMGEGDTANRSTADNISQVLKDSIKADIDHFAGQIRMHIFAELFQEANLSLSVQGAVSETHLQFHEIDMDNKIKEENHTMQQYQNNVLTNDEARKKMKMKPIPKNEEKGTHYERHVKDLLTHEANLNMKAEEKNVENQKALNESQMALLSHEAKVEHSKAAAHEKKAAAQVTVLKAKTVHAKAAAKAKPNGTVANRNRPANQHGRKSSPSKAKSSRESFASMLQDKLAVAFDLWDKKDAKEWERISGTAFEGTLLDMDPEIGTDLENSYTRQVRTESERLKRAIATTPDLEMLYVLLDTELPEDLDAGTEIQSDTADDDEDLEPGSPLDDGSGESIYGVPEDPAGDDPAADDSEDLEQS